MRQEYVSIDKYFAAEKFDRDIIDICRRSHV